MQRSELEHLIRASGEIAGDNEIIIIGSQAILGQFPDAPFLLLASMEADVYPKNRPDQSDRVDGAIGEGSSFHEIYGYYAQGVGEGTATLPDGWRTRLIAVCNENTNGVTGLCLEVHDLAISKLVARRVKDMEFIQHLIQKSMINEQTMIARLEKTDLPGAIRSDLLGKIRSLFAGRQPKRKSKQVARKLPSRP